MLNRVLGSQNNRIKKSTTSRRYCRCSILCGKKKAFQTWLTMTTTLSYSKNETTRPFSSMTTTTSSRATSSKRARKRKRKLPNSTLKIILLGNNSKRKKNRYALATKSTKPPCPQSATTIMTQTMTRRMMTAPPLPKTLVAKAPAKANVNASLVTSSKILSLSIPLTVDLSWRQSSS